MSVRDKEARSIANRKYYLKRQAAGKHREYMREFYRKRKLRLMELKRGRACVRCGFEDPRALDFHHRDRETKEFPIGQHAWKVSMERLLAEVDKCDVMCANCHRLQHFEDGTYDSPYASSHE